MAALRLVIAAVVFPGVLLFDVGARVAGYLEVLWLDLWDWMWR